MTERRDKLLITSFGFTLVLRNVPVLEFHDQWMPYINWDEVHDLVVRALAHKPGPLTGNELQFIRRYQSEELSELAATLGVDTATAISWEERGDRPTGMSRDQEITLRKRVLTRQNATNPATKEVAALFDDDETNHRLALIFDDVGKPNFNYQEPPAEEL